MPSINYRYYRLDATGHLHCADWFSAENDEHAIERIHIAHPNAKCEIWEGKRLVAKLEPPEYSPDDPDLQSAVAKRLSSLALRTELGLEGPDAQTS